MTDRRARTRERLIRSGLALFAAQGYDATTVAQIAAGAGVTEMTFFRHFAAKADVLLDDPYDPLLAAAVAAQPLHLDPLTRTVGALQTAWGAVPAPASDQIRDRVRIAAGTPSLRAAMWRNTERTEAVIVEQLVADGVARLAARVAAAAVLAGVTAALLEWSVSDGADAVGPVIEAALGVLDPTAVDRLPAGERR